MNATQNKPRVVICEDGNPTIYHWYIYTAEGNEFSHSAYHTDRAACEAEGNERLEYALSQGWL